MVQLQQGLDKFQQAGIQVVGVSPDSPTTLKKFSDESGVAFPLLSDPNSETIKAYGLHFMRGLPHPGTILIDQQGVVRAKLFNQGYRKRHTNEELLTVARGLKRDE